MFKVALNAGHSLLTVGKHCPRSLDPNMTKEWVLNNRVVTKMQKILSEYEGIEVLRIDDPEGLVPISFTQMRKKINDFGADFYEDIHHNALGKVFDGGGITAYCTVNPSAESVAWRDALYYEAVKETGLKGNRATPLAERDLHALRKLNCPAVLMECGFMDSRVDCPIILAEEHADKLAKAFTSVIIEKAGAKIATPTETQKSSTKSEKLVSVNLPILTRGCRGEAVRSLQILLKGNGADIDIDSSFGKLTELALREFQASRLITVDGSCGAETWTELLRGLNRF